jgi:hypothetical protein
MYSIASESRQLLAKDGRDTVHLLSLIAHRAVVVILGIRYRNRNRKGVRNMCVTKQGQSTESQVPRKEAKMTAYKSMVCIHKGRIERGLRATSPRSLTSCHGLCVSLRDRRGHLDNDVLISSKLVDASSVVQGRK